MTELNQKINFIKNRHLFGGLTNEQITTVAECFEEEFYHSGDAILIEGEASDKLYLIYRGSVKITRAIKNGNEEKLATKISGDYFGEMSSKLRSSRRASVTAEEETFLFAISRNDILHFITTFPKFKKNLDIAISSNQLARKLEFDWLFSNEVVYYVSRKHKILLWARLSTPLLVLFLAMFLFIAGVASTSFFLFSVSIGMIIYAGLLFPWAYVDWANDYYVVTNQRVIWLERLVGVFERRMEVPMSAILSVDSDTTFWGRMIDIGTVVMRTYTGQISLSQLEHSEEVSEQISDQWNRIKERERRFEKEAIKKTVREKLFGVEEKPSPDSPQSKEPATPTQKSFLEKNFSHFFQQRFEESGVITYRKFWVYLILQSWKSFIFMIASFLFLFFYIFSLMPNATSQTTKIIIVSSFTLSSFYFLFRWVYQYLDWSNDFFQITGEQVVDIERTPFGAEQQRSASLESILGVEFERKGLSRIIFNYGTVNINVGSTSLTFDEVKNPALVQQEILQQKNNRMMQIRKKEAEFPREQLAEWLDIYHQLANEDEQHDTLDTETNNL